MTVRIALILMLGAAASTAVAGECEDNFKKAGSVLTGTDFSSHVVVRDLSVADALGQMRGILIGAKMDVITEDVGTGTLLAEQRSSGMTRAVPSLVTVTPEGGAASIDLTVKTQKGQFAKADPMKTEICRLLASVKGGKEGKAAAAQGRKAQNAANTTAKDVYVFSREIAHEAEGNPLAVTARHKGRKYALKGKVDYIQEDGNEINVSFAIPKQSEVLLRGPNDPSRVGVSCLFNRNQMANVLTFRKGDRATFTGSFLSYDDLKRVLWLENCVQTKR